MSLRSRSQAQLDGLSAAVLMYVLHRHSALLPVRVGDINNKVLKDTARGAGRVVLKDVARRLRLIFGLRLVDADRTAAALTATTTAAAAASRAAGGVNGRAHEAGGSSHAGRKRERAASATTASSASDSYIVIVDQPPNGRASGRQQLQLSSEGEDSTTPKRLLSTWRAHSALLFTTLALCAFTYKDGLIAEERLLFLLGGLFGLGSAREMRQSSGHVLFGDVQQLITHQWVEQQYVERVTLRSEDVNSDFTMYGGAEDDNKEPHYRVGVRGRLEVGFERLYRFMVEEVMDSEVSEAGVKEMQRRDALHSAHPERSSDEAKSRQQLAEDGFSFTQPAANRRSSAVNHLPEEQRQTQRLAPYQQSVLRYLLAHSIAPENAVLSYYKQTDPPSARNPNLDELFSAINQAIGWAALRVERVASEYSDERVWMIVSRSDADTTLLFSAFSSEEVSLFKAWLQTLINEENEQGAAAMTMQQMESIAAHLDGVGRDRAKRLAEGSRELAERLTSHGWLYRHPKMEPQLHSIGMRSFIELIKPRALAAAAAAAASSSSSPASSLFGSLTLRLYECGRCRFDVYYGEYCGQQQDEQPDCRQKYHYHCVQRVRRAGQTMKCRAGHTWKPKMKQRQRHSSSQSNSSSSNNNSSEGQVGREDALQGEDDTGSDSVRAISSSRLRRHSARSSQQQQSGEEAVEVEQLSQAAEQENDGPVSSRRRVKRD